MIDSLFDPETAVIGGVSIMAAHLYAMAVIRKNSYKWPFLDDYFDALNYVVAAVLIAILQFPWKYNDAHAWQIWLANAVGLATLASLSANKVITGNEKRAEKKQESQSATEAVDEPEEMAEPTDDVEEAKLTL